jgi:hypothetical protein
VRFLFLGDGCKIPYLLGFFSANAKIAQPPALGGTFKLVGAGFSVHVFYRKGQEPDSRFAHF